MRDYSLNLIICKTLAYITNFNNKTNNKEINDVKIKYLCFLIINGIAFNIIIKLPIIIFGVICIILFLATKLF